MRAHWQRTTTTSPRLPPPLPTHDRIRRPGPQLVLDLGEGYIAVVPCNRLPAPMRRPTAIRDGKWCYTTFKPVLRYHADHGAWLHREGHTKPGVIE